MHFLQISGHPDWQYTLDVTIRYGYLLWLLAYFFTSNLRIEQGEEPKGWDLPYDVLQSILSLIGVFCLGFMVTGEGFAMGAYRGAAGAVDIAIFFICAVALWAFHKGAGGLVNGLRIAGAVLALVSLSLVIFMNQSWLLLGLIAGFLAALWIVLGIFIYSRGATA